MDGFLISPLRADPLSRSDTIGTILALAEEEKSMYCKTIEISSTDTTTVCTHLLQAAGTPAGNTAEWSDETDDFTVHAVLDLHVEAAQRAAAIPRAAVVLLLSLVDALAKAVLYVVLIVGLEADKRWAGGM